MKKNDTPLPIKWLRAEKGLIPRRRPGGFTLLELITAITIMALLAMIAFPTYVHARANSERTACLNNLRQIDEAKQEWGLENNQPGGATPGASDLAPYLRNHLLPSCPSAGVYTIGSLSVSPACNIARHAAANP
jgi:prepilin-type N-terminal cleavage/methylation domain-containing protein